jgi:type IV pilus assembly protein PilE
MKRNGLTLIELLIVLAIISILATLAYPTYQGHLYKTRRNDGHIALLNLASAMELYYLNHHSFQEISSPEKIGCDKFSPEGYYQLSITTPTAQSYLLTATPHPKKGQQDDICGKLTLSHRNEKGADAPNCW